MLKCVYIFSPEVTLESRLEYLARAIMSAKSCNLRTAGSGEGEFLHELEEKLEVARIQMQVYQALVKLNASNPSRRIEQALAGLNSQLLDVTIVRDNLMLYKSFNNIYLTACDVVHAFLFKFVNLNLKKGV